MRLGTPYPLVLLPVGNWQSLGGGGERQRVDPGYWSAACGWAAEVLEWRARAALERGLPQVLAGEFSAGVEDVEDVDDEESFGSPPVFFLRRF